MEKDGCGLDVGKERKKKWEAKKERINGREGREEAARDG